jgi:hypothetical protein
VIPARVSLTVSPEAIAIGVVPPLQLPIEPDWPLVTSSIVAPPHPLAPGMETLTDPDPAARAP